MSEAGRLVAVLFAVLIAASLSFLLPDIDLSAGLADVVVLVTDTATWPQLPLLSLVALTMVVSRPNLTRDRRRQEALTFVVVLMIVLGGNAALNEFVVKPAFGIPRPNIQLLAESGALGPEYPDAESIYAVGGKEARRKVLGERLPFVDTPALTDRVEARWIHETGYSFPSGHTTAAMTLASLLVLLAAGWPAGWRLLIATVAAPVWAVSVGYSRVLLGVHRPADVVAGTVAGILWGLLAFLAIRRFVDGAPGGTRPAEPSRG